MLKASTFSKPLRARGGRGHERGSRGHRGGGRFGNQDDSKSSCVFRRDNDSQEKEETTMRRLSVIDVEILITTSISATQSSHKKIGE